jgi:hypothetical protein
MGGVIDMSYDAAKLRVDGNDLLKPYRSILLDDWPEGESHYLWVAEADESEIWIWARDIASHID